MIDSGAKRLISLIVLCSLSVTALGLVLWQKKHSQSPVPVVLNTGTSGPAHVSRLQLAVPKVNVAEYSARVIRENPLTPMSDSGRPDPFAKLPEERDLPTPLPVTAGQLEPARIVPSPPPPGVLVPPNPGFKVRGIIRGKQAAAFIEESEKLGYRRVGVGDPLCGGRVVTIGENGIEVEFQGKTVFYSLGE